MRRKVIFLPRADTPEAYNVDSDSEEQDGHEDKRPHPNDRLSPPAAPGKKGPRKSKGEDGQKPTKENKAARRKEQNRAAQKAFRERREAKVKDVRLLSMFEMSILVCADQ